MTENEVITALESYLGESDFLLDYYSGEVDWDIHEATFQEEEIYFSVTFRRYHHTHSEFVMSCDIQGTLSLGYGKWELESYTLTNEE